MDVEGLVMIGLVTIGLSDVFETLQQQKCIEDLTPIFLQLGKEHLTSRKY